MIDRNNMDLGIDGGTGMEGTTWWKRDGSDHFKVREVLITDTGFEVRTEDGRMISADTLEQYIQSEVPITGNEGQQPHTPRINPSQLEGIDPTAIVHDEQGQGSKNFGSLKFSHPGAKFQQPPTQRMMKKEPDPLNDPIGDPGEPTVGMPAGEELDAVSYGMIDRVLGDVDMKDLAVIQINPIEKVNEGVIVLANTLNIKRNELRSYMANRIAEKFQDMLDASLTAYFNSILEAEELTEEQ